MDHDLTILVYGAVMGVVSSILTSIITTIMLGFLLTKRVTPVLRR